MNKNREVTSKEEILDFITKNPTCYIATIDGNQPRVRGLLMYHADEDGILFQTWSNKDIYRQIQQNPNVELCFVSHNGSKQVRIAGKAEFIDDQKLKEEIVDKRSFIKPWVEEMGYDVMKVFKVINCVATVWTPKVNFKQKEYIQF
jgi:uncharacterized pyridoxamine 5'-phosphate oxidase family protein